jgi:hypothetical protein
MAALQAAIAGVTAGAAPVVYSGPSLTLTGTQYLPIGGGGLASTTETNVDLDSPAAATIQNFSVQMSAAPGVGNSVVFTWRKNASSTALTCTISGASATNCSDLTHSFTVAASDLMDIQAVTTGTIVGTPTLVMGTQFGIAATGGTTCEIHAASNSASLNFTSWYSSSYKNYIIQFDNLIPQTNSVSMFVQMGASGTYDAAAHYAWSRIYNNINNGGGTPAGSNNSGALTNGFPLWNSDLYNGSSDGLSGTFTLYDPANGNANGTKGIWQDLGQNAGGPTYYTFTYWGYYTQSTASNNLRVIASSGNIVSGQVSVCPVMQ